MKYTVEGHLLQYEAEGQKAFGADQVLLNNHTDLTSQTGWHEKGFGIEPLLEEPTYSQMLGGLKSVLYQILESEGLDSRNLSLDQYHQQVKNDNQKHIAVINKAKLLQITDFPIDISILEERISEICNVPLITKNPFDNERIFHFRIIRPNSTDNNPLHRDVWLEDYDDCINLYIPITGSTPLSSLILLPGSHLWKESRVERTIQGAKVNGVKFNVPAVSSIAGDYAIERPNPGFNEVLVFSPYLIHGGAMNLNSDKTRISLEMRLWKK